MVLSVVSSIVFGLKRLIIGVGIFHGVLMIWGHHIRVEAEVWGQGVSWDPGVAASCSKKWMIVFSQSCPFYSAYAAIWKMKHVYDWFIHSPITAQTVSLCDPAKLCSFPIHVMQFSIAPASIKWTSLPSIDQVNKEYSTLQGLYWRSWNSHFKNINKEQKGVYTVSVI